MKQFIASALIWKYVFCHHNRFMCCLCPVINCPDPGVPENGQRTGNGFTYLSEVLFQCSSGYRLQGRFNLTCLANGSWSSPRPQCAGEFLLSTCPCTYHLLLCALQIASKDKRKFETGRSILEKRFNPIQARLFLSSCGQGGHIMPPFRKPCYSCTNSLLLSFFKNLSKTWSHDTFWFPWQPFRCF